jgi:hypothetical protein
MAGRSTVSGRRARRRHPPHRGLCGARVCHRNSDEALRAGNRRCNSSHHPVSSEADRGLARRAPAGFLDGISHEALGVTRRIWNLPNRCCGWTT